MHHQSLGSNSWGDALAVKGSINVIRFREFELTLVEGDDFPNDLVGTPRSDGIFGYGGDDTINWGGGGLDQIYGGDGNDKISGSVKYFYGGDGNDELFDAGRTLLYGGTGDDVLHGNGWREAANDTLYNGGYGGAGQSRLA